MHTPSSETALRTTLGKLPSQQALLLVAPRSTAVDAATAEYASRLEARLANPHDAFEGGNST